MLRLKRLLIHRHPLLKPGTELNFSDRVNLLIGLNGTGKTTLLELIDMALRQNFSALEGQPFKIAYEVATDTYRLQVEVENSIRRLGARGSNGAPPNSASPDTFPGDTGSATSHADSQAEATWFPTWRYELRWNDENSVFPAVEVRVDTSVEVTLHETAGSQKGRAEAKVKELSRTEGQYLAKLMREDADTQVWSYAQRPAGLLDGRFLGTVTGLVFLLRFGSDQPFLVETPNLKLSLRYDEALEWWRSYETQAEVLYCKTPLLRAAFPIPPGGSTQFQLMVRSDHYIARAVHRPWNMFFTGGKAEWKVGERRILQDGSVVIEDIVELLELDKVELELELTGAPYPMYPDEVDSPLVYTYRNPKFFITKKDGTTFEFDGLSFGQKRLFAFLCYLNAWPEGPVVVDELANGLHHRMIEYCRDKIGNRQAFLATQNALLLDYYGFENEAEVAKSFVVGELERKGQREWISLRNFTTEEAHEFYKDLEVGIQHVSEILRTRGLW